MLGYACDKFNNYFIEQFSIIVSSCQRFYVHECVWCVKNCSVFEQKLRVTYCKGNGIEFWFQSTKITNASACLFILDFKGHTRIGSAV